jgi:N4-gp56 family major capsid protein
LSITTTSILPSPIQQSFNMKLLSVPVPNMIHKTAAFELRMPQNGGRILRSRRYNPLAVFPAPLGNSGTEPAPQVMTATDIDVQISFYGSSVILNEQVEDKVACFKPLVNTWESLQAA